MGLSKDINAFNIEYISFQLIVAGSETTGGAISSQYIIDHVQLQGYLQGLLVVPFLIDLVSTPCSSGQNTPYWD